MSYKTKAGYVRGRFNGRLRFEHDIIMEELIGRPLTSKERVHHINGVRVDNRPENLEFAASHSDHLAKYHPHWPESRSRPIACSNGHPYYEGSFYLTNHGKRKCKECSKDDRRSWYANQSEEKKETMRQQTREWKKQNPDKNSTHYYHLAK